MWIYMPLFSYVRFFNNYHQKHLLKNHVSSYIIFSGFLILALSLKDITRFLHCIYFKIVIVAFPINYIRVLFQPIARYYSSQWWNLPIKCPIIDYYWVKYFLFLFSYSYFSLFRIFLVVTFYCCFLGEKMNQVRFIMMLVLFLSLI